MCRFVLLHTILRDVALLQFRPLPDVDNHVPNGYEYAYSRAPSADVGVVGELNQ